MSTLNPVDKMQCPEEPERIVVALGWMSKIIYDQAFAFLVILGKCEFTRINGSQAGDQN